MNQHYSNEHSSAELVKPEAKGIDGVLELVRVWTDPEARKQGFATELIKSICDDADIEGRVLMLTPKPFGKTPKEQNKWGWPEEICNAMHSSEALSKWYERFGFVTIQKKPVVLMARMPQVFKVKLSPVAGAVESLRG